MKQNRIKKGGLATIKKNVLFWVLAFLVIVSVVIIATYFTRSRNGSEINSQYSALQRNVFQQSATYLGSHCAGVCHLHKTKDSDYLIKYNGNIIVSGDVDVNGHHFTNSFDKNVNIAPGTYRIKLETFDSYVGRADTPASQQSQEQHTIVFKHGSNKIAETGKTQDLKDGVEENGKISLVNSHLNVSSAVDKITIKHAGDYIANGSEGGLNGFEPVCMLMEKVASCGDGEKNGNEECDEGKNNGKVPEVAYGKTKTYCKSDCTLGTVVGGKCGNNKKEENEQCDDGNSKNGDGCSSSCQKENPGIQLDKTVSKSSVSKGEKVTYFYKISNNGPVDLKNIKLDDDKLGKIDCPKTALKSHASMTCVKDLIVSASVKNTAVVTGEDKNGAVVTDKSDASVSIRDHKKESCDSSIGNYIWYDTNGNGIQESIEEGISNIKVCAFDGNKKYCDTTNRAGRYKIKDLCKGTYTVVVKGVGNMQQTYDPDGKKDNKTKVKLKKNKKYTKADFGYRGGAPKTGVGTSIILLLVISALVTTGFIVAVNRLKYR